MLNEERRTKKRETRSGLCGGPSGVSLRGDGDWKGYHPDVRASLLNSYSFSSVSTLRANIWYCHPLPPTRLNWMPCRGRRGTLTTFTSNRTHRSFAVEFSKALFTASPETSATLRPDDAPPKSRGIGGRNLPRLGDRVGDAVPVDVGASLTGDAVLSGTMVGAVLATPGDTGPPPVPGNVKNEELPPLALERMVGLSCGRVGAVLPSLFFFTDNLPSDSLEDFRFMRPPLIPRLPS